ncbi:MAG: hypothetical protein KKB50_06295, partial [Planctomycetes bacterium]|nr:hypothetical protein [Planctomycetota bacterium]
VEGQAAEGKSYLRCIAESATAAGARLSGIKVKPRTGYVARCRFRVEKGGAHFTFGILNRDGSFFVCRDMYACTREDWDESVLPFRTEDQTEITMYVGRRYGATAILFDTVELVEDDTVKIGDVSPSPNPFPQPTEAEQARGFIVSAQHWLRLVYPTCYPTRDEVVSRLECRLAPGEYEPVTFALTSLRHLKQIQVKVAGDLKGQEGRTIPAGNVSIGIVRTITRWLTNGAPLKPGQRFERRPLLIFPNQEFDVPEKETHELWITVGAAPDQAPGLYQGEIVIAVEGKTDCSLPLVVKVLPIKLAEAEPTYGMYYRHTHQPPDFQTEEFFRRCMADMKAHGMNSMSVYAKLERKKPDGTYEMEVDRDSHRYSLTRQMRILGEAGLLSPTHPQLLLACDETGTFFGEDKLVAAVDALRRERGWPELLFYLVDEPGSAAQIAAAKRLNDMVHRVPGVRTTTAIGEPGELADYYDVWIVSTSVPRIAETAALARTKGKDLWAYNCQWNGSEPANDRYYCGYHTWTAALRGNWQWCYTEGYKGSSRLSDEIELKLPYYEDPWYVNYVLPTSEANIATLGWEGRREGIDDYRYLQTLRDAVAEAEKSESREAQQLAGEARKFLQDVETRTRLPYQRQSATNAGQNYGFTMHPGLKPQDYDQIRDTAADFIIRLTQRPTL